MSDRTYFVNKIKELVSKIDENVDDSVVIGDIERYANDLKRRIEYDHSGIYIAIHDQGPDDNFIRYYTLLGKMTTAQALAELEELSTDGYDDSIREVSIEEWHEFNHLICLTEVRDRLNWIKKYNDVSQEVRDDISKKVDELREKLGLVYRWEVVDKYH